MSVEFDVAVTATQSDQAQGGIGLVAGVFGAGVKGKTGSENSQVSRIKFTVPIVLPPSHLVGRDK